MRTAEQFRADAARHRRTVHFRGKTFETPAEVPQFVPGLEAVGLTFRLAGDPSTRDLATAESPFVGAAVSRFNHIPRTAEDLAKKIELTRLCASLTGACPQRCISGDVLSALYIVTKSVTGEAYHDRLLTFLREVQTGDRVVGAAQTDAKGHRKRRPHEQADADSYLHLVKRDRSGIVVRGVKQHDILVPYADDVVVLPSRSLRPEDRDFAVSFAIPVDTPGLEIVSRSTLPDTLPSIESPVSRQYGFTSNTLLFKDVFVPWDRVFLCGETDKASDLARLFGTFHRHTNCGCRAGQTDVMVGAALLMAQLNGVDREPHVRSEIIELCMIAETVFGVALGAAVKALRDESGVFVPEPNLVNVAQYQSRVTAGREFALLQDVTGGVTVTMPHEEDLLRGDLKARLDRAFTGAKGSGLERLRAVALAADLAASAYGGWRMVAETVGGVGVRGLEVAMHREYDLESRLALARRLAGVAG